MSAVRCAFRISDLSMVLLLVGSLCVVAVVQQASRQMGGARGLGLLKLANASRVERWCVMCVVDGGCGTVPHVLCCALPCWWVSMQLCAADSICTSTVLVSGVCFFY